MYFPYTCQKKTEKTTAPYTPYFKNNYTLQQT